MSSNPLAQQPNISLGNSEYSSIPVAKDHIPNGMFINDTGHTSHRHTVHIRTVIAGGLLLALFCGIVGRRSIQWTNKQSFTPDYNQILHSTQHVQAPAELRETLERNIGTGKMRTHDYYGNPKASYHHGDDSWIIAVDVGNEIGMAEERCPAEKPELIDCWCSVMPYPACVIPSEGKIINDKCVCGYSPALGPCAMIVQYSYLMMRCK